MTSQRPRILIVEDEALIAEDLRTRLDGLGYEVVGVLHRAEEVLAAALETTPDLVLLDIKLKGAMDGIAAGAKLSGLRDVPFVFVTSYADRATLDRAERTHPYGYLLKPFDERSLQAAMQMALGRHRVERQVRCVKEWFGDILQSIGDAVVVTDTAENITYLNRSGEHLTQWRTEEALGRRFDEVFRLVHGPDDAPVPSIVAMAMQQDGTQRIERGTGLIARDGSKRMVEDSAAPVRRSADASSNGAVVVMRDCSEQSRLLDENRLLQGQLREVRRQRELTDLMASLAHDFGNVLTAALGAVEICRTAATAGSALGDQLRFVERALTDAAAMCHRMRAAQPERQLDLATVDATAMVHDVVALVRPLAGPAVDFRFEVAAGVAVRVDRLQMQRVLTNLVKNAIESLRGGTGRVTVRLRMGRSDVPPETIVLSPAASTLMHACLDVEDNGCGMDAATRARMFDPLFTTKGRGRGLGLAGALVILKYHGAGLAVGSEPGEGTRIGIQLPLA